MSQWTRTVARAAESVYSGLTSAAQGRAKKPTPSLRLTSVK